MRKRGIALMTALMFISFLLVVGLAFMTMIQMDYSFARQEEARRQAYFLAESGIEYYRQRPFAFTVDVPQELSLPQGDPSHIFRLVLLADGTVRSEGMIRNGNKILAQRTLVAPQGNFAHIYDETQE
jgi:type II secretory pathway component PulK